MFELIRADKTDRRARNVVSLLNDAAECLHTARPQAAEMFSAELAEQITSVFAAVDALYHAAARELDRLHEQKGEDQ